MKLCNRSAVRKHFKSLHKTANGKPPRITIKTAFWAFLDKRVADALISLFIDNGGRHIYGEDLFLMPIVGRITRKEGLR